MKLSELLHTLKHLEVEFPDTDPEVYIHDLQHDYMYSVNNVYDTLSEDGAATQIVLETDSGFEDDDEDNDNGDGDEINALNEEQPSTANWDPKKFRLIK